MRRLPCIMPRLLRNSRAILPLAAILWLRAILNWCAILPLRAIVAMPTAIVPRMMLPIVSLRTVVAV